MNIFKQVKAEITPKAAAERYGIKVFGNNMICCPFHNDRHPSMKLNNDYFYCFSCGASGDVVDLTAQLFGIKPIDAAQKLAADFGVSTDRAAIPNTPAVKHPKLKAFREDELYCFKVLCEYLHILEDWQVRYAPKSADDELDERFVEACQMLDCIEHFLNVLTVGTFEERAKTVKDLLTDGKMQGLEKIIERERKENNYEQDTEHTEHSEHSTNTEQAE